MNKVAVPVDPLPGQRVENEEDARLCIRNWISALRSAERMGAPNDHPEGSRYIQISDSFAQGLVLVLLSAEESLR